MRRTPLKRYTELRRISANRREREPDYEAAKRVVWVRDGGVCQARKIEPTLGCWGRIDPHHTWPQGRYPEFRCDPEKMILACRLHHDLIHGRPAAARVLRLLV